MNKNKERLLALQEQRERLESNYLRQETLAGVQQDDLTRRYREQRHLLELNTLDNDILSAQQALEQEQLNRVAKIVCAKML